MAHPLQPPSSHNGWTDERGPVKIILIHIVAREGHVWEQANENTSDMEILEHLRREWPGYFSATWAVCEGSTMVPEDSLREVEEVNAAADVWHEGNAPVITEAVRRHSRPTGLRQISVQRIADHSVVGKNPRTRRRVR